MKVIKFAAFILILLYSGTTLRAQAVSRYLISFKNKANNSYSLSQPAQFLSQRSLERRSRQGILLDSSDLPVTQPYVDSLKNVPTVTVLNVSKWLNQVSIQTTNPAAAIAAINRFSFVRASVPLAARRGRKGGPLSSGTESVSTQATAPAATNVYNYGASYAQVHLHNGEFLHNLGLRGENVIISMLDAGFMNYKTVRAFDSARTSGQILGTYDFVAREISVNEDNAHGMQCFSTIAANIPGQFVGTAPKALFYLFRTEEAATEYPIEEHNWVCAAEKSDSAGSDLLSSSLGYFDFDAPLNTADYNHTYAQLNGNSTVIAIGADLAAKKGMLVITAAGNEGNNAWHYILTPADGDSVLAVGAVNASGTVAGFSSYGPTADGRIKPDLASYGINTTIQQPNNTISTSNGTSYAAPNLAGLAACLWQGFPERNNMQIIDALRTSGSIAGAPNNRIGYGIPDVKKALLELTKSFATATGSSTLCKNTLNWTSKDVAAMNYEIERKAPGENTFNKIGERRGTGSVFSTHTYNFTDSMINLPPGGYEYRIRQLVDSTDMTQFYFPVVTLQSTPPCPPHPPLPTTSRVLLLPNPAKDFINVNVTTVDAIADGRMIVSDMRGTQLLSHAFKSVAGTTSIRLNTSTLNPGKYFVSVYNETRKLTTVSFLKL